MPKVAETDTRGQIAIPLDGTEYVLRPSYEAISNIERITGRALYDLAGDATSGTMTLDTMGVVVCEMMRAHAKSNPDDPLVSSYRGAQPKRIAELIYEESSPNTCARLAVVLIGALTGGYTASGEVKTPGKK